MNKEIVKSELKSRLEDFVKGYPYTSFLYGYDEVRNCFLVSYTIDVNKSMASDKFWTDLLGLQEIFLEQYGDAAPLFCEEEELFKLPYDSETIQCNTKMTEQEVDLLTYSRSKRGNRMMSARYPIANV